ncbi:FxLYD domain-containing protein [Kitasatospora sp. NBC_01250]|uniref:FxLYD domain-containing protein n=1 Tax=Kitasatospora sp. NBC_01250 TaxID=2903571 RepID=UPI002E37D27E|nr:FxLYD domain-containing protein [Kitasatospora sp. NBC_01250]
MNRSHAGNSTRHTTAGRLTAATALVLTAGAVAGLAACSSSSKTSSGGATSATPFSPATASFSGSVPSGVSSLASSAQAAVSSAASSVSAAAASFEASVSAAGAKAQASASAALADVTGTGNAVGDVTLTGVPKATSGGLNAVVVTITNSTSSAANYAVRIDFLDASGAKVDSTVVGVQHLAAGQKAQPVAFSTKDTDVALSAKVATAQRY